MRFDDRLSTVLSALSKNGSARDRAWAQLVDILAQDSRLHADDRTQAYFRVRDARSQISDGVRRRTALALSGQNLGLDMFLLLAEDLPPIAAPILLKAQLSEADWVAALPKLSLSARALVRERRDLSPAVLRHLSSFGSSDFALPPAEHRRRPAEMGQGFQDLLARIERRIVAGGLASRPAPMGPLRAFRFVTDTQGVICSATAGAAAALVGLDLAKASVRDGLPDPVAAAFQDKAAFRAVTVVLPSVGPIGGAWRISAVPRFSAGDGRFLGYRGIAKRPIPRQGPGTSAEPSSCPVVLPDGLRQFIHELRTPLNAVRGFADLLVNQIFGPVSQKYQLLAHNIMDDTQAIIDILDDLPFFVPGHCEVGFGPAFPELDPVDLVWRTFDQAQVMAARLQVKLDVQIDADVPHICVDSGLMRRLLERFVRLVTVLAAPFDDLQARLVRRGQGMVLTIRRPQSLRDLADADLFNPAPSAPCDPTGAPFGRGFGFRLIWALARALGGQFETSRRSLALHILS